MKYQHLIAGKTSYAGITKKHISPIDRKLIGELRLLSIKDIEKAFVKPSNSSLIKSKDIFLHCKKLAKYIEKRRQEFVIQIVKETGYTKRDSADIVDGTLEFLRFYKEHSEIIPKPKFVHPHSLENRNNKKTIYLERRPYGSIAVICPQNAPLILETISLVNTLFTNNVTIIKPSTQTAGTASLLIEGLMHSFSDTLLDRISIITCKAPIFLQVAYEHADLIHFIGSSRIAKEIVLTGFCHGRKILIDGEGGSTVLVDKTTNIKAAIEICKKGIIRCNGELCTSIKGIVVHSSIYQNFVSELKKSLGYVTVGDPLVNDVDMGPIFNTKQICPFKKYLGINNKGYIKPTIITVTKRNKELMQKQIFGPVAWIVSYNNDEWKNIFRNIRYPLTDVLLSKDPNLKKEFVKTSNAPRIVFNSDPSEESVFEPWGSLPPSGINDVSFWIDKYQKVIQINN
jgi:aldehyde dehydrogenase (NAD+)